ncbi:MAG: orotidine-5'-phosphate decarboxylase [Acidobacteriota bacterium]
MAHRLIVALDGSGRDRALHLVDSLLPLIHTFKIGLTLFTAHGPAIVEDVATRGARIFLDLKFHDIPNTISGAIHSALNLPGVDFLTLHASGGRRMMAAARQAVGEAQPAGDTAGQGHHRRPALLGVSVLTSLHDPDLQEVGMTMGVTAQVERLARLAAACGLDGVVCSPLEAGFLRRELGADFLLVTPGIRPNPGEAADQKRFSTPSQALENGASLLVIGRPITAATAPLDSARRILDSLP